MGTTSTPLQRARRWFWGLLMAAVLLAGALSAQVAAAPHPAVGVGVALTGTALALVLLQASRILLALGRAARQHEAPG